MDRLSLEISEGMIFDLEIGPQDQFTTFAQRVEGIREALSQLLWRTAEALNEPDVPGEEVA